MTPSEVSLCNMALNRIGVGEITDLIDGTDAARACKNLYANTRDTVLESKVWRFATARAVLTPTTDDTVYGWEYAFPLPSETLSILTVDENTTTDHQSQVQWQREGNRILSDESKIYLTYIKRVEDTTLFSSGFTNALSLKLAAELATSLKANQKLRDQLLGEYERALLRAGVSEGRQGRSRKIVPPSLYRVR